MVWRVLSGNGGTIRNSDPFSTLESALTYIKESIESGDY
jgi:hypothetical protein